MKINKFIEFLSDDDESELIEFIKSHIADLIDLGFYVNIEVSIIRNKHITSYWIMYFRPKL